MVVLHLAALTIGCILFALLATSVAEEGLNCSISAVELDALYDLYLALNGQGWRWNSSLPNSTQWTFPSGLSTPCSKGWQGLQCQSKLNASECSVAGITLNTMELRGHIPDTISNFSSLQTLDLASNLIEGQIPDVIQGLSELTFLSVAYNFLVGTISYSLFKLTKLQSLFLNNNEFFGSISGSIGNLSELVDLRLHTNYFHNDLPPEICLSKNNLTYLSFYGNFFDGSIPHCIYAMTRLEVLQMGSIRLEGMVLFGFDVLAVVDLDAPSTRNHTP
jgi:hypothetical protein